MKDKLSKGIFSKDAVLENRPFYADLQKLYYQAIIHNEKLFDDAGRSMLLKGKLSENIKALYTTEIYPLAAEAFSYANEENKKWFFESGLVVMKGLTSTDRLNAYGFLSSFLAFCVLIRLSENDWKRLVSAFKPKLTGLQLKNIVYDFSVLLRRKEAEISGELLNYILFRLGNEDADIYEPLAVTLCNMYMKKYPDYIALIRHLLKEQPLCKLRRKYMTHREKKRMAGKKALPDTVFTSRNVYPYCLLENTISKICTQIIRQYGIKDGHALFLKEGWYAEENRGYVPFYVNVRRKSMNLALANFARNKNSMEDLEELILECLNYKGTDQNIRQVFKEEALYLCRNSVRAEDHSPYDFTDKIYNHLVEFLEDESMKTLMDSADTKRFYAKHNLFAMFAGCNVTVQLRGKNNRVRGDVSNYTRNTITIKARDGKEKVLNYYEICRLRVNGDGSF